MDAPPRGLTFFRLIWRRFPNRKQPLPSADREEFEGTGRFELVRRLGAGGFGVVYEALDRERGARVALKVLRASRTDALYHFKQEFRALADIAHPNLVSLYELLNEGGRWFFTMELVRGRGFLEWVWEQPVPLARLGRGGLEVVPGLRAPQAGGGRGTLLHVRPRSVNLAPDGDHG